LTVSEQLQAIVAAVTRHRFTYNTESELQRQLAEVFAAAGIPVRAEHRLASGRVDFMAFEAIGIEVKVKGQPVAVLRQLQRYATDPECAALVLISGRSKHRCPSVLEGKPVLVIPLWAQFL
jgi:RecB family endonuclease NucS